MRVVNMMKRRQNGIALLTTLLLLLLMSSLLVGFIMLVMSTQRLSGMDDDQSKAFYASEAGMEKITADLGTLFGQTYSPSGNQINGIVTAVAGTTGGPPALGNGTTYNSAVSVTGANLITCPAVGLPGGGVPIAKGGSGYEIGFCADPNGNPVAQTITINSSSSAYQGMQALATTYKLLVTAQTTGVNGGSEVKMLRTTQSVGIPMFQFGVFSDMDLSFHAGPTFNFGGRTHTNGNLFLAEGSNNTLTMADRVTAFGEVVRDFMANGYPLASGGYGGTVNITTSPGGGTFRALGTTEGSVTGGVPGIAALPTTPTGNWLTISLSAPAAGYSGNLRNNKTGVTRLNLAITTLGNGLTQPVDILRRPPNAAEPPAVTAERLFAQASFRILLSDNPQDIMQLPCVDLTAQPFNLADIAQLVGAGGANWAAQSAAAGNLYNAMIAAGTTPLPLATSNAQTVGYLANDGYWIPKNYPIVNGYIKIEIQGPYGNNPCGLWKDVTQEVLAKGYVGKNIRPVAGGPYNPSMPGLPGATVASQVPVGAPCAEPHPNAIIRLERVRDNPTTGGAAGLGGCGTVSVASPPHDFWPNVLFDAREGALREGPNPNNSLTPTLGGVMDYIEIDAKNLAAYLKAAVTGNKAPYDALVAPNDFAVYISDRRSNGALPGTIVTPWPPTSPTLVETGEYGYEDVVNPASANNCPNGVLDRGEDVDGTNVFFNYGGIPASSYIMYGTPNYGYGTQTAIANLLPGQFGAFPAVGTPGAAGSPFLLNPNCQAGLLATKVWPGTLVNKGTEARANPNFFFRRAVKIVNGNKLDLGTCPGINPCGLTIASENPVYVQGDYNANWNNGGWGDASVGASIMGDAVTLLSKNWNDVNSFAFPYNDNSRPAVTTWYRAAIISGKGLNWPHYPNPTWGGQDDGSDGGIHNFLRYIEDWGPNGVGLNYNGSLVSIFYSRQAVGIFKCCGTVYEPPNRGYQFDINFLTPALLPPRTPLFRDINTTGFAQLMLPTQ